MACVLMVGDLVPAREVLEEAGLAVLVADDDSVGRLSVLAFDAVLVVEGESDGLLHLLQRGAWEHKLIAGIGHGVIGLARAELLEGSPAACPGDAWTISQLLKHGGRPVAADLCDDGHDVITARDESLGTELAHRIVDRLVPDRLAASDFGLA
jgi:putative intracellular protease/amidase